MYLVSKSLNVGGNEFLSEGNNNLRNLGEMRLRGLNQTSRLTRGGQTSMGRGRKITTKRTFRTPEDCGTF